MFLPKSSQPSCVRWVGGPKHWVADVFYWPQADNDIVIANLFLHHFEDARLAELLNKISRRTKLFIALEPRRARWPLFCSWLLWAIITATLSPATTPGERARRIRWQRDPRSGCGYGQLAG